MGLLTYTRSCRPEIGEDVVLRRVVTHDQGDAGPAANPFAQPLLDQHAEAGTVVLGRYAGTVLFQGSRPQQHAQALPAQYALQGFGRRDIGRLAHLVVGRTSGDQHFRDVDSGVDQLPGREARRGRDAVGVDLVMQVGVVRQGKYVEHRQRGHPALHRRLDRRLL